MLKKNCSHCDKRIERRFRFCPWCGKPTKKLKKEDYGMLGFDDEIHESGHQSSQSFLEGSLGNVFNQLTKQLSRELQNLDLGNNQGPRGIEIRFSTGKPVQRVVKPAHPTEHVSSTPNITNEEIARRKKLPIEVPKSKVRRLPEGIVYEIDAPGVETKQDVSILRMENSIEVRAFSKDKCYIKTIPIKVDILKYSVKDNKVFIHIKN